MIQPSVHKRDIGIKPHGCGGRLGLIGRPSGTYLRDDAATHFSKDRHCWRGHIAASLVLLGLSGKRLCYLANTASARDTPNRALRRGGVEIYITPDDQQLNCELKWTIIGSGTILMVGLIF